MIRAIRILIFVGAVRVADDMGSTKTNTWEKGAFSYSKPSKKLLNLLEPYKMSPPKKWWNKIIDMP